MLTHERECDRPTNTGRLALQAYPERVERILWSRTSPCEELVAQLAAGEALLLFPKASEDVTSVALTASMTDLPSKVVILDATWQEARKMLRQSVYLLNAHRCHLSSIGSSETVALTEQYQSQFRLRRNQIAGGLCTVECVVQLFYAADMSHAAQVLTGLFHDMNQRS